MHACIVLINTTQHNTTQHNTTQHNTTQPNPTQPNPTQHNTTQHNTTQHNTTQHNTTQHNTTQHNTTQHNTTQHNTTQHKICGFVCCHRGDRGGGGGYFSGPCWACVNTIQEGVGGYFLPLCWPAVLTRLISLVQRDTLADFCRGKLHEQIAWFRGLVTWLFTSGGLLFLCICTVLHACFAKPFFERIPSSTAEEAYVHVHKIANELENVCK